VTLRDAYTMDLGPWFVGRVERSEARRPRAWAARWASLRVTRHCARPTLRKRDEAGHSVWRERNRDADCFSALSILAVSPFPSSDFGFSILDFGMRTGATQVSLPEAPSWGEGFLVDSLHEGSGWGHAISGTWKTWMPQCPALGRSQREVCDDVLAFVGGQAVNRQEDFIDSLTYRQLLANEEDAAHRFPGGDAGVSEARDGLAVMRREDPPL